ncbi:MAG: T9SS type A sorting domain-containing protein [Bacteroidetes bacterium]|nr:T9SS type A sorting domain-containing protein [Bacteroidota bacterium]MCL2301863.1 T9SS type A sorting domain-containing protein [Lentimicrobiaceae bacterium]
MKKNTLLSLVLMFAGFIATAQNNRMMPHHFSSQHPQLEYSDFDYSDMKNPYLLLHKAKSGKDWWQPDTVYVYPPNSEQPSHREIFSYNAQELLTEYLQQSWQNNNWVNDRKDFYTYDTQNKPLTRLSQSWYGTNWVNNFRNIYTYDAQNNLITDLFQGWYGNWVNSWRDTYTYDAQNNLLTELGETWQTDNWMNSDKGMWTYDENNNSTTVEYWVWQDEDWQQGTVPLTLFYNNMQSYIRAYSSGHKRTATYFKLMTNIAENAAVNITVYPNPTNGQLQVKSYELQVTSISFFDIYGRSIQTPSMSLSSPETVIDLSHLLSGLYFVRISTTVGEIVKKILKE